MYPLTIGLAIENRELWDRRRPCLADLPFRVIVEHQDVGDVSNFLDRLERMRPDVVLVDISGWKEPLEGLVASIRAAAGDPMIIALNTTADADAILSSLRAGVNEYLYPPFRTAAEVARTRAAWNAAGGARAPKADGKSLGFLSAKGGCGATTLACHVAAELGRLNQKVLLADLDLDAGMVAFITKTKSVYSILDAVNNLHRLDISLLEGAGVERHSRRRDHLLAAGPGLQAAAQGRADPARAGLRAAALRLDAGGPGPQPEPHLGMAALEEIDEACLVTTLEVPALHQSKQIIQTLLDSGYGKNRIRLILNRAPKRLDITPGELEKMLGTADLLPCCPTIIRSCTRPTRRAHADSRTSELGKQIAQAGGEAGRHRRREVGAKQETFCTIRIRGQITDGMP